MNKTVYTLHFCTLESKQLLGVFDSVLAYQQAIDDMVKTTWCHAVHKSTIQMQNDTETKLTNGDWFFHIAFELNSYDNHL